MESGSQGWLPPDETLLYSGRQSLRREIFCALPMAFGAATAKLAMDMNREVASLGDSLVFAAVLGLAAGMPYVLVMYRRFEVALTDRRLYHRRGLLRRRTQAIDVADIVAVDADKSGDHPFDLRLASGRSVRVRNLPRLDRLRDAIALARRELAT